MARKEHFEEHCWKGLYSEEIYRIYEPYKRETELRGRCAVLMIDLYNMCYEGGNKPVSELVDKYPSTCGEYAWNALPHTKALLEAARKAGLPIIYSTKDNRNSDSVINVNATQRKRKGTDERHSYEIHSALAPADKDLMVFKERASCFFGTPLVTYLQKLQIETLIVCGESTSGCVRATVLDSYSYGFHTVIAEQCVFDRNYISHQCNLFDLHHKYADVMDSTEIIAGIAAN
ncbi:MAG: isochorismatase family protein [Marinobacter sp.]|jgi:maleamate amidohydrolase|uniref:isochorismatase family protein n=1 Tax=Marinobacter sp. TaxID=50741 RepID=UPI003298C6AE